MVELTYYLLDYDVFIKLILLANNNNNANKVLSLRLFADIIRLHAIWLNFINHLTSSAILCQYASS